MGTEPVYAERTSRFSAGSIDRTRFAGRCGRATEALEHFEAQLRAFVTKEISVVHRVDLEVDDVLQVTYTEAFRAISHLDARGASAFYNWLKKIAENTIRDGVKALERRKRPQRHKRITPRSDESYCRLMADLEEHASTPSRQVAAKEIRQLLESGLAAIPPEQAKALRLYDLEGLGYEEVAIQLSCSVSTAWARRKAGIVMLAEYLGASTNFFST